MKTFAAFAVALSFFAVASAHATDTPPVFANDTNASEVFDHVDDSSAGYKYTMMTASQWQWLCDNVGYPYC